MGGGMRRAPPEWSYLDDLHPMVREGQQLTWVLYRVKAADGGWKEEVGLGSRRPKVPG